MAKDKETPGDWDNVPQNVPYFDPAGVYQAEVTVKITQVGRMEEQGSSGKMEMVPIQPPVVCYESPIKYGALPVDGVNIVGIALMKAQQDIQAAGMIVRTPILDDASPDQAVYVGMMESLNRPSFTPEQIAKMKELMASK